MWVDPSSRRMHCVRTPVPTHSRSRNGVYRVIVPAHLIMHHAKTHYVTRFSRKTRAAAGSPARTQRNALNEREHIELVRRNWKVVHFACKRSGALACTMLRSASHSAAFVKGICWSAGGRLYSLEHRKECERATARTRARQTRNILHCTTVPFVCVCFAMNFPAPLHMFCWDA